MKRRAVLVVATCTVAALGAGTPAWAFWTVGSSGATGTAAAGALGTPTVATSGASASSVTVAVTAAPPSGPAPTGYRVARTGPGTAVASVCTISGPTGTCTDTSPVAASTNTYQVYARFTAGGASWESFDPATATAAVGSADSAPPANALSVAAVSGGAYLAGSGSAWTLYYRGTAAGVVKLVDAVTDAGSGPASAAYPALAATGWTHAAETVTTPAGGPYTSSPFSWGSGAAAPGAYTVTGSDAAGNTATATVSFASDGTAPTGGSIAYPNGYVTASSVAVTTSDGTDAGSGVDTSSRVVQRAAATMTAGTCGAFGSFTTITLAAGTDTTVASGTCYRYQFLVSDRVGNQSAPYASANVAKVDFVAPVVTAITLANQNGTAGNDDTLTVAFSEAMDPARFCSAWSSTATGTQTQSSNNQVTVTITDNGANDTLTVTSTGCTVAFGSVALGGDYVGTTTAYGGSGSNKSMFTWDPAAGTVTVTLGTPSPSNATNPKAGVPAGTPTYTPASGLADLAGNALATAGVPGSPASRF